jgi:hypothetical protein
MSKTSNESKKFKIVNVEGIAMYAHVHTPQKAFNPEECPLYKLDLVVDDKTAKVLTAEGLKVSKVKVDEDTLKPKVYSDYPELKVFTFKRKTEKRDGTKKEAPEVLDSDMNPIPSTTLVGNGSRVCVSISPYTVNVKGKDITGAELLGVQVLELVPFEKRDNGFKRHTGGFKVTTNSITTMETDNESMDDEKDPFED